MGRAKAGAQPGTGASPGSSGPPAQAKHIVTAYA